MKTEKLGQEPAFPVSNLEMRDLTNNSLVDGMSKRFYAACAAMQGILSSQKESLFCDKQTGSPTIGIKSYNAFNSEKLIRMSYKIADELLKQESE